MHGRTPPKDKHRGKGGKAGLIIAQPSGVNGFLEERQGGKLMYFPIQF